MALSVCLVTRNEAHNLPRVLHSVAGVADQVIVADTGSTDRTAAVAAELGATVRLFEWTEDFAAAQNFALSHATGDWILWLNPDEELLPASQALVKSCLSQTNALGFLVAVQEVMQADRPEYCTETVQLRLYRRRPDLHFIGRLHARLDPPLEELARREGKPIYPTPITIRHHAYLSVLTEAKLRWAARLLELELRDRPGQLAMLIDYGNTLLRLKDPAGHDVMAAAVEQILPGRNAPAAPAPQVQLLLEYLLTVAPQNSRSRLSRDEAWELALRWFPTSPPLFWWRAAQLFREGDFRQAADLLARLVEFGQTGRYNRAFGFDPSIIRENALANLGACFTHLRQLDRAEQCFRQLLASPTHRAQAAQNLAVVESLRRRPWNASVAMTRPLVCGRWCISPFLAVCCLLRFWNQEVRAVGKEHPLVPGGEPVRPGGRARRRAARTAPRPAGRRQAGAPGTMNGGGRDVEWSSLESSSGVVLPDCKAEASRTKSGFDCRTEHAFLT